MKKILAVTPGDPDGIGPEIVWKAMRTHQKRWVSTPLLCVGARAPFDRLKAKVILADSDHLAPPKEKTPYIWLLEAPLVVEKSGALLPGFQSGWSIEIATQLVKNGACAAIVTGPISKERLQKGGYPYSGHTDFLAELCGVNDVTMMLANHQLKIALATVHVGLKEVSAKMTSSSIIRAIEQTFVGLRQYWGKKKPKIAVLALNPHAGESGLFGKEEIEVIVPAIKTLRDRYKNQLELTGPYPADTFFAQHVATPLKKRHDAVICMYHDQGLIPVKMLDFPHTVNVTLGLPIIRTSVDHGTGFDIAWKNRADPTSFISAVDLAREMIKKETR